MAAGPEVEIRTLLEVASAEELLERMGLEPARVDIGRDGTHVLPVNITLSTPPDGVTVWPPATKSFIGEMAAAGCTPELYKDERPRRDQEMHSNEVWLPVVLVIGGTPQLVDYLLLLAKAVLEIVPNGRPAKIHAFFAEYRKGDTQLSLKAITGSAEEVAAVLQADARRLSEADKE